MKFVSIPENGSAWSNELIYNIDTETESPINLMIEIRDLDKDITLGRCRLYNITKTAFNIAPYLRSKQNFDIHSSDSPMAYISPASRNVGIVVNGRVSEGRTFYRVPLRSNTSHALSRITSTQSLSIGEPIRLTAYCTDELKVNVEYYSSSRYLGADVIDKSANGQAVEIVIPTGHLPSDTERMIVLVQQADGMVLQRIVYCIVERTPSARRLMWQNRMGGVECYTFPLGVRTRFKAQRSTSVGLEGTPIEICSTEEHYTLSTAYEVEEEIARIAEIVFSPHVYELRGEDIVEVELTSREVLFGKHGILRQLSVEICERGRGGVVC